MVRVSGFGAEAFAVDDFADDVGACDGELISLIAFWLIKVYANVTNMIYFRRAYNAQMRLCVKAYINYVALTCEENSTRS